MCKLKKFRVVIDRTVTESATVEVEAADDNAAADLAIQMGYDNDVKWDSELGDVTIELGDVEEIEEEDDEDHPDISAPL